MEFWKTYRIVKARRWMILGLLLITLLTVWVAKKVLEDQTQYVTSAIVLPSPEAMSTGGFYNTNKADLMNPTSDRYSRLAQFLQEIRTHFDSAVALAENDSIEQKRAVVQALSSKLNLDQINSQFAPSGKKKYEDLDAFIKTADEGQLDQILKNYSPDLNPAMWGTKNFTPQEKMQVHDGLTAVPVYDSSINTTPGSNTVTPVSTDYIQIGMHAADPNKATLLANLLAATFINGYKDAGLEEYNANINSAKKAEHGARVAYNQAQDALIAFKKNTPLVELGTTANAFISNMQQLKQKRDQAEVELQVAQKGASNYEQLAEATGQSLRTTLDPLGRPQVQALQVQIAQDEEALDALKNTDLLPTHPRYQKAQGRVDAEKRELQALEAQPYVSVSVNPQYQSLKAQANAERSTAARAQQAIQALDAQITQQQQENETLPDQEKKLATLTENYNTSLLQKKAADANIASLARNQTSFNQGLISMETPATDAVPDTSGPSLAVLLIYGAILSLIIGIAAAIGLDYLDNSVQTIPDAEKLLGMPVSAVIPLMPPGDPRRQNRLTVSDPLSPIAEAYRLLRTDLLFTAEEKPFQSLMAATAKPGQGATTTICNLAVALATVGKRVILIDADLRRPKLHDFFSVSNEIGLTSLLRDECELEEALKVTDIDNLLVLPSGPLPLNPAELLASQKMRSLHDRLKPHTDFVLVDTPSAIAFSDSSILASYLDAVMIVVRAQETPRGSEVQLKNMLKKARANIVGVVLNGVKPQLVDSYFYHAAYYPQITTGNGHALGVASNGGVLPPPNGSNGHHGKQKTHERTLEGDTVGETIAGRPADESLENIESTVIMDDVIRDDIVTVTPQKSRGRFSLRRKPDNDQN